MSLRSVRRRGIRRGQVYCIVDFTCPAYEGMVPWSLVRGEVGKGIEEGRCASAGA
jgi:hypothetical protein